MDLDTTRNKNAHQDLINQFAQHQLDILIGTQMVTKGLDFDNVSLVAVLNADSLLNTPDFRSHETAFQMLEQVAGRAGRRGERGEVIIQTFMPDLPIFAFLSQHDYVGLYQHQIAERQLFHYPPFYRLIDITLKHRNNDRLLAASTLLQERLQQVFGHRCSPIIIPSVARMHNTYLRHILLRIEGHADIQRAKQLLMESIHYVQSLRNCLGTIIIPDVDPM
jgi:primosomal protein N' (replication factor Y)